MLLFLCLWNKRRRGSNALSWGKKKKKIKLGIVPCMRKRCVKDYSGDLHLDLRKKRSTASLPGFGQNVSLLKDRFSHPHLPTRAGLISHPNLLRTGSRAPIPADRFMVGTIGWDHESLPKPKPARVTATPSVRWGRALQPHPLPSQG